MGPETLRGRGGTREHAGHPAAPASRTKVFERRIWERVVGVLEASQLDLIVDSVALARQRYCATEAVRV